MHKFLAILKKEVLLLLRDPSGLAILFLMPMALVFIMTLIQESTFNTLNEAGIPIVLVDNDKDSLGASVIYGLSNTKACHLTTQLDGKPATVESAEKAVAEGKFMIGIVIPAGATKAIRSNVQSLVEQTLADSTVDLSSIPETKHDTVEISMFIDPVTKRSFINATTSALREFISQIKSKIIFTTFSEEIEKIIPGKNKATPADIDIVRYREEYAAKDKSFILPNSVQHNVPAWTIFGMFFIVVPLAGSILKEKTEGTSFRLRSLPGNYVTIISGKISVYVMVCMIQFILMISVGVFILPMLGLPSLQLGTSHPGIIAIALSTAIAASGFGVMIGTFATTDHQSAISGSLSIVLFSAIGGIWVPPYVMPAIMQQLSSISPLNWGLNAFYELFLRGAGLMDVWQQSFKLIIFFFLTVLVAHLYNQFKKS
jgi:ABC-2 type transport system permease protein